MSQQLRTRDEIAAYFLDKTIVRDLGRGAAFPTAADGITLTTGDRFFRTDMMWHAVYDGARWLTAHTESLVLLPRTLNVGTTSSPLYAVRQDYAIAVVRYAVYARVSTTNNGSNYWNIFCQSFNLPATTNDNPYIPSTSGSTVNTWVDLSGPASTPIPTNRTWFAVQAITSGSPGQLDLGVTMYYRLIIG